MTNEPDTKLATNAPSFWPSVFLNWKRTQHFNDHARAQAFQSAIRSAFGPLEAIELSERCCTEVLTPEGLITVPAVVHVDGEQYHLFFYQTPDEDAAAHFAELERIAKTYEALNPIYYAPQKLPAVPAGRVPSSSVADASSLHMRYNHEPQTGMYVTWWSGDQKTPLAENELLYRSFAEHYKQLRERHYALIVEICNQVGEKPPLPDEALTLPVILPGNHQALVTYDPKKGTHIHFNLRKTPLDFRNTYLLYYMLWVQRHHQSWSSGKPIDWWTNFVAPRASELLAFGEVQL